MGRFIAEVCYPALVRGVCGAEKFLTRYLRITMDALGTGDLGNVAWVPGTENPADGLTKVKSEIGPFLNPLETGAYRPGASERLRGASFIGKSD